MTDFNVDMMDYTPVAKEEQLPAIAEVDYIEDVSAGMTVLDQMILEEQIALGKTLYDD